MFFLAALLVIVLGSSVVLLLSSVLENRPEVSAAISLGSALLSFVLFAFSYSEAGTLLGMIRLGGLSAVGGMIMTLVAALTILGVMPNPGQYRAGRAEFYMFVLYTALGGTLMVAANNLLLLYIGIEMSSYSTYVLVGYTRDNRASTEAATKYFVLGALASAFLLYGMSFLFGATGSLYYDEMAAVLAFFGDAPTMLYAGLALLLVGFGFKLALVPFHAWTPDAYQGAPTMVAALLSVGPKVGAVFALGNLLIGVFGFGFTSEVWREILAWLAALTMTMGNLQALRQRNLKRLLGYSSVAQLGTILVGLAAGTLQGFGAVVFYGVAYAFTNIGAFTSLSALREGGVREELGSYTGLGRRAPLPAVLFTVFLLSLAGVPLLAGFLGKLFVFSSAVGAGMLLLAVVAVLNTILAYAYYLRVVVAMWLEPGAEDAVVEVHPLALTALVIGVVGVVLLGMFPTPVLGVIAGGLEPLGLGSLVGR